MEILCFFAGTAFVYFKNLYPLILVAVLFFFRPKISFLVWFLFAVIVAYAHQWWHQDYDMPEQKIIKNAILIGSVDSIPKINADKTQFQFYINQLNGKKVAAKAFLTCYKHCPRFKSGQKWRVTANLKRPRNLGNPGHFDYSRFLAAKHIYWTGSLKADSSKLLSNSHFSLLSIRERLADDILRTIHNDRIASIIQALTIGVTNHIDKNDWDLFRQTGTIHLMVISGAHIGLVAGIVYFIIRWSWCLFPRLCLFYPAQSAASIAALWAAFSYTALAGFGVPAQRALIVCVFMFMRNFSSCHFSIWQAWRYSLLGVLLFEPHSVLMSGFYLSFIAVAVLLIANQRFPCKGIKKTIILQASCLVGLMPFTVFLYSYGAINGLMANLIAVPIVGFVIVPLSLLLLAMNVSWLSELLTLMIGVLLNFLSWVDSFSFLNVVFHLPELLYPVAVVIALVIILFIPQPYFLLPAFLLVVSVLFPHFEKIKEKEVKVSIMDVGQGLAVIARTANHILIYDTGAKFHKGADMGKLAIIPYLDKLGVNKIDKIIISHSDLDHRGGLQSLEERYRVEELVVDDPSFYQRGLNCHQYPTWSWDGIDFRFFPIATHLKGKNNHSCVLQIKSAGGALLLTGDIEKTAEQDLVRHFGKELKSSVVLVPHHGSKTSSTESFIKQVAPDVAIASYGFENRYHFPHAAAMETYQKHNIPILNTVDCGLIEVTLNQQTVRSPHCSHTSG